MAKREYVSINYLKAGSKKYLRTPFEVRVLQLVQVNDTRITPHNGDPDAPPWILLQAAHRGMAWTYHFVTDGDNIFAVHKNARDKYRVHDILEATLHPDHIKEIMTGFFTDGKEHFKIGDTG